MNKNTVQLMAIIKKELRIYFNSPIAYIFLVALLGFTFWMFFRTFFVVGQIELRSFFDLLPWTFLLLIPAMTMRLWAEEKRGGTIETLLTSSTPIPVIVMAKFLASLLFLFIALAATLLLPIVISTLGNIDWGAVLIAYLGALFLGAGYISIGLVISAFTNNQIVAFILSVVACFTLYIIAQPIVTFSLPSWIIPIIDFASFGAHYDSITRGVVDTRDIIYFVTFIALMLYFNSYILISKR
ncbi:ABC transporter permease subunit [Patescibacteria group bacterium]|nr:ABC transporter permease subunit [Patescibacteria group bacterium]